MGVSPRVASSGEATRAAVTGPRLQKSRVRGESFLLAQAKESGWSDFLTPVGESNQWVSGYVAGTLARCDQAAERLSAIGRRLSAAQRISGGWGYNAKAPADADSTAAVLAAFAGTGRIPARRLQRAARFLTRHEDPDRGGFCTFRRTLGLRLLMRAFRCSFHAWCSPQVCVTGAAIEALARTGKADAQLRRSIEFLTAAQRDDGLWDAYWWHGPYYATAAAMRAFRSVGASLPNASAIETNLIERQESDGSWDRRANRTGLAFSTACAVACLSQLASPSSRPAFESGLTWLIDHQSDDGSWASEPIMQIPHPYDGTPNNYEHWREDGLGTGVLIRDQHRIFTTATVVRAMGDVDAIAVAGESPPDPRVELPGATSGISSRHTSGRCDIEFSRA